MKKIFSTVLILTLTILTLTGCASYDRNMIKIGMFVESDLNADAPEITVTVAALTVNKMSGKISDCTFDRAEFVAANDGVTVSPVHPEVESAKADGEFARFAKSVEEKLVGKSFSEADGEEISTDAKNEIWLQSIKGAVKNADENPYSTPVRNGKDAKLGLSLSASSGYDADAKKFTATVDVGVCVVENEKVVAAALNSVAPAIAFESADGSLVPNGVSSTLSKQALLEDYNMVKYANAIAEWYIQAQRYADEAIGMKVSELEGLPQKDVAGCTVYVGGFRASIIDAASRAE